MRGAITSNGAERPLRNADSKGRDAAKNSTRGCNRQPKSQMISVLINTPE